MPPLHLRSSGLLHPDWTPVPPGIPGILLLLKNQQLLLYFPGHNAPDRFFSSHHKRSLSWSLPYPAFPFFCLCPAVWYKLHLLLQTGQELLFPLLHDLSYILLSALLLHCRPFPLTPGWRSILPLHWWSVLSSRWLSWHIPCKTAPWSLLPAILPCLLKSAPHGPVPVFHPKDTQNVWCHLPLLPHRPFSDKSLHHTRFLRLSVWHLYSGTSSCPCPPSASGHTVPGILLWTLFRSGRPMHKYFSLTPWMLHHFPLSLNSSYRLLMFFLVN